MDFDLVPVFRQETKVLAFAKHQTIGLSSDEALEKLKAFLCGLQVQYGQTQDASDAQLQSQGSLRIRKIRDLKSNSEVGQVMVNGAGKHVTVRRHMRDHGILLDSTDAHFPLADIGFKKPFWVPLDVLIIPARQFLKKTSVHQEGAIITTSTYSRLTYI
ncbi:hypothetical protein CC80DRAFT_507861 [Byssothecium circinans]|uniref:PAZ domain-containing protein n=1 Tax=Byssothecium circinans TaxID=147558 RepID=A0A6A5TPE8_9PLEO|nr:hypothetical protein CC80DRAFT_507861 [Byssothecium circinans]